MMNNFTVVMYHYVRDLKNSRFKNIKGLDINLFVEQIKYIHKHYHVTTMEEILYSIDNNEKMPNKSILLTFDDAYLDHYTNVFPILDKYNMEGSFYVPVKTIKEHSILDVNKIHFILASVEDYHNVLRDIKEVLQTYSKEFNLESFEFYYQKLAKPNRHDNKDIIFIKRLLQVELPEEVRSAIVNELFAKYINLSENEFCTELYMTQEQLEHMHRLKMHIGVHGYNHYWWNKISTDKLEIEIDKSLNFLNELNIDTTNWTACYPYGGYNQAVVELIEKKGCKLAFTVETDIANLSKYNRLTIPRLDTNDLPKSENEATNQWYNKA